MVMACVLKIVANEEIIDMLYRTLAIFPSVDMNRTAEFYVGKWGFVEWITWNPRNRIFVYIVEK